MTRCTFRADQDGPQLRRQTVLLARDLVELEQETSSCRVTEDSDPAVWAYRRDPTGTAVALREEVLDLATRARPLWEFRGIDDPHRDAAAMLHEAPNRADQRHELAIRHCSG